MPQRYSLSTLEKIFLFHKFFLKNLHDSKILFTFVAINAPLPS